MRKHYIPFTIWISIIVFACNFNTKTGEEKIPPPILGTSKDHPKTSLENYLIKSGQAGQFVIGKPIPSAHIGHITQEKRVRNTEDGMVEEPSYLLSENGVTLLTILPKIQYHTGTSRAPIREIIIHSDMFHTAENVGVNTTITEFQHRYPDRKLWYTYVSDMYVMETSKIKAQFLLNKDDFIGKYTITKDMISLKKEDFKQGAKISKIRLL